MKYIIFEVSSGGKVPIIFPNILSHKEVARRIVPIIRSSLSSLNTKPVSAGFISSIGNCYGESESLHLKSLPEDTNIIQTERAR